MWAHKKSAGDIGKKLHLAFSCVCLLKHTIIALSIQYSLLLTAVCLIFCGKMLGCSLNELKMASSCFIYTGHKKKLNIMKYL